MPKKKEPQDCLCECGEKTLGGKFRPGHDAKLKSALLKSIKTDSPKRADRARARMEDLGWSNLIPAPQAAPEEPVEVAS